QLLYEGRHATHRAHDPIEARCVRRQLVALHPPAEELRRSADHCQWSLQLMSDSGQEIVTRADRLTHFVIETGVLDADGDAPRELARQSEILLAVHAARFRGQEHDRPTHL